MALELQSVRIGVLGLGYVGLPLAASFARSFDVVGFDIDESRIEELSRGHDRTLELSDDELSAASRLSLTTDVAKLDDVNVFIVATPTPIDKFKNPDLSAMLRATRSVGSMLKHGDVVIFESTVYPGAVEETCVPVLEGERGLVFNDDFFVGYSPERINPGDREHRFESIVKVTSGSTPECAAFVDALYSEVVTAGTHLVTSIKVAEAAKVIENTQRDVNIALVNELALIFNRLGIDTQDVLDAAGTKWNFLGFRPGLVGGHCIGVDPYYLTHKAEAIGHHPEMILAGRRINDSMGEHVASQLVREMLRRDIDTRGARVLVLGMTFKENTPDLRNTRVIDIVEELQRFGLRVDVTDPWASAKEAVEEYGISLVSRPRTGEYDATVLAVKHQEFTDLGVEGIRALGRSGTHVFYDLKSAFSSGEADLRL